MQQEQEDSYERNAKRSILSQPLAVEMTLSPLQTAHLLTFSKMREDDQAMTPPQQLSNPEAQIDPIGEYCTTDRGAGGQKAAYTQNAEIRHKLDEQTPCFSRPESMCRKQNSDSQQSPEQLKKGHLGRAQGTSGELKSGHKLVQELMAISSTVTDISQKALVQGSGSQRRNMKQMALADGIMKNGSQESITLRSAQKSASIAALTDILSPKTRRLTQQSRGMKNQVSPKNAGQQYKNQQAPQTSSSNLASDEKVGLGSTQGDLETPCKSMRQTQYNFFKSKTAKLNTTKKKESGSAKAKVSLALTSQQGSSQARNAYLSTIKPVNFQGNFIKMTAETQSKTLLQLSEQKSKQNRSKQGASTTSSKEPNSQFNPALIYGKKSFVASSSHSTPQIQLAQRTNLRQVGGSAAQSAANTIENNYYAMKEQPSPAQGEKRASQGTRSSGQKQISRAIANQPTVSKNVQTKAKRQLNLVTQSYMKTATAKSLVPKTTILASSVAPSKVSAQISNPQPAQGSSTQQFKRNRFLVDKAGKQVLLQKQTRTQLQSSQSQAQMLHQSQQMNQAVPANQQQVGQPDTINFQVKIEQPTAQPPQQSLIKPFENDASSRVVQSSQQQKRQVQQFMASFQSQANSSQGFLRQSQNYDGGITTQFSFQINGNSNQPDTGVELRLTQGNHMSASVNADQFEMPLQVRSQPSQDCFSYGSHENMQRQQQPLSVRSQPNLQRQANPTMFHFSDQSVQNHNPQETRQYYMGDRQAPFVHPQVPPQFQQKQYHSLMQRAPPMASSQHLVALDSLRGQQQHFRKNVNTASRAVRVHSQPAGLEHYHQQDQWPPSTASLGHHGNHQTFLQEEQLAQNTADASPPQPQSCKVGKQLMNRQLQQQETYRTLSEGRLSPLDSQSTGLGPPPDCFVYAALGGLGSWAECKHHMKGTQVKDSRGSAHGMLDRIGGSQRVLHPRKGTQQAYQQLQNNESHSNLKDNKQQQLSVQKRKYRPILPKNGTLISGSQHLMSFSKSPDSRSEQPQLHYQQQQQILQVVINQIDGSSGGASEVRCAHGSPSIPREDLHYVPQFIQAKLQTRQVQQKASHISNHTQKSQSIAFMEQNMGSSRPPITALSPNRQPKSFAPYPLSHGKQRESYEKDLVPGVCVGQTSGQESLMTDQNVTATFLASGLKSGNQATEAKMSQSKQTFQEKSAVQSPIDDLFTVSKIMKPDSLQLSPNAQNQRACYEQNRRSSLDVQSLQRDSNEVLLKQKGNQGKPPQAADPKRSDSVPYFILERDQKGKALLDALEALPEYRVDGKPFNVGAQKAMKMHKHQSLQKPENKKIYDSRGHALASAPRFIRGERNGSDLDFRDNQSQGKLSMPHSAAVEQNTVLKNSSDLYKGQVPLIDYTSRAKTIDGDSTNKADQSQIQSRLFRGLNASKKSVDLVTNSHRQLLQEKLQGQKIASQNDLAKYPERRLTKVQSLDSSVALSMEKTAPKTQGSLNQPQLQQILSKQCSRVAANVVSVDCQSQASSTSRIKQIPAKVIYNKFFKDKGFLPPLLTAPTNPQNGAATNIQGSRCPSVNSHFSGEHSNRTLQSMRAHTHSPDHQQRLLKSGQTGSERLIQMGVQPQASFRKFSQNQMQSQGSRERAETKDFDQIKTAAKASVIAIPKSTADKYDQLSAAEHESNYMRNLIDNSIESRKGLGLATSSVRKSSGVEASAVELQNCFSNALNMALSSAPIQHRSYPGVTSKANIGAPNIRGTSQTSSQIDSHSHARPKYLKSTFAVKGQAPLAPSTLPAAKSSGVLLKQQQQQQQKSGKVGIVYTGKEKPDAVIQQLTQARLRNLRSVATSNTAGIVTDIAAAASITDSVGKDETEPVLPGSLEKMRFHSPHSHAQNVEENWACIVPEVMTEPKREISGYVGEPAKAVKETQLISEGISELKISEAARAAMIEQVKLRMLADVSTEERKAEDPAQASLKKIVSQDKLKYRLQSSKNRQLSAKEGIDVVSATAGSKSGSHVATMHMEDQTDCFLSAKQALGQLSHTVSKERLGQQQHQDSLRKVTEFKQDEAAPEGGDGQASGYIRRLESQQQKQSNLAARKHLSNTSSLQASISREQESSYGGNSLIRGSQKSHKSAAEGSMEVSGTRQQKLRAKGVKTLKRVTSKHQKTQEASAKATPYSDGYKLRQSSEANYMTLGSKVLNFKKSEQLHSQSKKCILLRDSKYNLDKKYKYSATDTALQRVQTEEDEPYKVVGSVTKTQIDASLPDMKSSPVKPIPNNLSISDSSQQIIQLKRGDSGSEANMTFGMISHQMSFQKGSVVSQQSESALVASSGQKAAQSILVEAVQKARLPPKEANNVGSYDAISASSAVVSPYLVSKEDARVQAP